MAREITARELAKLQDKGESYTLLDTRDPESYRAWHLDGAVNFPFEKGSDLGDDQLQKLSGITILNKSNRLITICGKGRSSSSLVEALERHGFDDVAVVSGGMAAWSRLYHAVPIDLGRLDLEIVQVQRRAKGCLGYVVGSVDANEAAIVDPTRHTSEFTDVAREMGCDTVAVLDTHVHADHVSGGRTLADELDVPYYLGSAVSERGIEYRYQPLSRNNVLSIGEVDLKAVFTPGHTTESVCYLVDDVALLTGDTLMAGSVGRTELEFGEAGLEDGARQLYNSIHGSVLSQAESVAVLPGHAAVGDTGEWEDSIPGEPVQSSIGELRTELDVLVLEEAGFVGYLEQQQSDKPNEYERILDINLGMGAIEDDDEATELELGPNRCAAS